MYKVDLNSDIGEGFGAYSIGMDEEILKYVSSANIACGWHAGDACIMEKTVINAKKNNVAIGAHPGLPDLLGFGRRNMSITKDEAKAYVKYQIGALLSFAIAENIPLQHVKPHGALYNMAAKDIELARGICQGIYEVNKELILLGLAGSNLLKAAKELGLLYASEVFADRAYNDDGTLVSRNLPGAVLHDENLVVERTIRMIKDGKVESINGKIISIEAHSVCVHGDNSNAIVFVSNLSKKFRENGIEIANLNEIVR